MSAHLKGKVKAKIDTSWMGPKKQIWIERTGEQEIFVPAILESFDLKSGAQIVDLNGNKGQVDLGMIFERADGGEYNDMVDMEIINDAELLVNLNKRYVKNLIFTYVGPTLLVVNPFRGVPELVSAECKQQYVNSVIHKEARNSTPPHIYSIGAEAYKALFGNDKNQAIIISGESGAGKTENAKLCMNMITMIKFDNGIKQEQQDDIPKIPIEDKILSCNPILEAFGNAKTVRNNNSSRFGKYTRIYISKTERKIKGAEIFNYLLEKSRLCLQGKGERNFHIFYLLLKGMPVEELEELHLANNGKVTDFKSINYVNTVSNVDGIDDVKLYQEIIDSIQTLGLESDRKMIFQLIATVLHFGDLQFDESTLSDKTPCSIVNQDKLAQISQLLQMTTQEISEALTLKQREIQKQIYNSPVSLVDCYQNRDSWAKELFGRLFNWLVIKLNETIIPKQQQSSYIGLLDIYGFEVFDKNGFEQLMINYTNERLHQLYISYVFKGEELVFKDDGLAQYCGQIKFSDNQGLIEFLDKPPLGIFDLLDESCQIKGDDDSLLQKIRKTHRDPKLILQPRMPSSPTFIVVHTAKDVEYCVQGFREKNMDEISVLTSKYSANSGNTLVQRLFPSEQAVTQKKQSLSKKIRIQMNELMKELTSQCEVHFVRCIKPNDVKKPLILEQDYTLQQIRYLGVLDSLKVRKQNYPFRRLHQNFYKEFGDMTSNPLFDVLVKQQADFKKLNESIFQQYCKQLGPELVLFGTTRIFIRVEGMIIFLEIYKELMAAKHQAATKLQKKWKKYKFKQFLLQILRIVKKLKLGFKNLRAKILRLKQESAAKFIYFKYRQFKNKQKFRLYKQQLKIIMTYSDRYQSIMGFALKIKHIRLIQYQIRLFLHRRRIEKNTIGKGIIMFSLDLCWEQIRNKMAIVIQKNIRGFRIRNKNKSQIQQIKQAKQDCVQKLAATKIGKNFRGMQVRRKIKQWNASAFKIQGFVKMKWLSNTFNIIQSNTPKIQRLIRRFLINRRAKHIKQEQFEEPLAREFGNCRTIEENDMFGAINSNINSSFLSVNYNSEFEDQNVSSFDEILSFDRDPQKVNQKGFLFNMIIDIELLLDTSDHYKPSFSKNYKRLFQYCYITGNLLQTISVGSCHSLASTSTGKLYTWGLNSDGQLGQVTINQNEPYKPTIIQLPYVCDQIATTEYNSYVKTQDGQILIWGELCDSISLVDVPPIKQMVCNINTTYLLSNNKQIYYWNQDQVIHQIQFKLQVDQIAAGYRFVGFLTTSGQIYMKGENDHGELGQGDNVKREEPTLIKFSNKFIQLSCGFKHCCAKTNLGKIFVWGWNQDGQLGLGDKIDRLEITQLSNNQIVSQIQCGRTSTLLLIENKTILWCGTNGSISLQDTFYQINLKAKAICLLNGNFSPVRILSTYSKSISLITVTFVCQNNVWKGNLNLARSCLQTLTQRWNEENIYSIDPPNVEVLSKYFIHDHMKKKIVMKTKKSTELQIKKRINQNDMIEKTNRSSVENQDQKNEDNKKDNYLKEMKEKIEKLKDIAEDQWNAEDQELMLLLQTQDISQLLDQIL